MRVLLSLLFCSAMFCQTEKPKDPPVTFYRLDFAVKELEESKVVNSRSYSMTISTDRTAPPSAIRTGTKVPYQSAPNQFQYADVGVNIDCRAANLLSDIAPPENMISFQVSADVTSLVTELDSKALTLPIIRQNRWSSNVLVPLRKPTTIFSSDDVASRRKMQLELTVIPLR